MGKENERIEVHTSNIITCSQIIKPQLKHYYYLLIYDEST